MKKKFDCVQFQRKVRLVLSKKFNSNRSAFLRELREKYGYLRKQRSKTQTIVLNQIPDRV